MNREIYRALSNLLWRLQFRYEYVTFPLIGLKGKYLIRTGNTVVEHAFIFCAEVCYKKTL